MPRLPSTLRDRRRRAARRRAAHAANREPPPARRAPPGTGWAMLAVASLLLAFISATIGLSDRSTRPLGSHERAIAFAVGNLEPGMNGKSGVPDSPLRFGYKIDATVQPSDSVGMNCGKWADVRLRIEKSDRENVNTNIVQGAHSGLAIDVGSAMDPGDARLRVVSGYDDGVPGNRLRFRRDRTWLLAWWTEPRTHGVNWFVTFRAPWVQRRAFGSCWVGLPRLTGRGISAVELKIRNGFDDGSFKDAVVGRPYTEWLRPDVADGLAGVGTGPALNASESRPQPTQNDKWLCQRHVLDEVYD